ncbi:putative tail fiber protein [Dickeya phage vB_DsoM_JA33]|uniref:Putative tail fiber protein n=3 Tax=Salmondvirus JA11 TaxID=2734141 RepID=A0A384ZW83_9CAUD|nr:tail fiber protein [Dickeya phage vB_DsoM_JA11]AXG66494.1 putative tail fiber protein [Dickeya phage vB_DsoM_JA13]AXG67464.1 putative tail fiber protein [Dickeya phage vB_DsoM_JA33]AYD79895.1 putative tail fiber protein [Dickeya phage vB_DsoM_JA11]
MGLVQVDPALIDPKGGTVNQVLAKVSETQVGFRDENKDDPSADLSNVSFDSQTGTLTIIFQDGTQKSVSGLPTADQMKAGKEGKQGKQGIQGNNGKDGKDGRDGEPGCPGIRGTRGRQGPTGNTGPIGPTGETGPVGPTGAIGPTGPAGRDAIINQYEVSPVLDPLTGNEIVGAFVGSDFDPNTGRTTNFGRAIAPASQSAINVAFNKPFLNRCASLTITFLNAATNQAKTYSIYNTDGTAVKENVLLGGFMLKSTGANTVGWDFYYSAIGD